MKKIFVVDDHSMVRDAFVKLLELTNDMMVVGVAGSGLGCLEKIGEASPDVLLLDINLPDINGIEVLKRVKEKYPSIKVIMLTVHDDYAYAADALHHGVDGYVLKGSDVDSLTKAIESVVSGEKFIVPSIKNLLKKGGKSRNVLSNSLTTRENEVLDLLAEGFSNRAIAERLQVSEKTVKNHLSNIFKKIGVSDRINAVIYALKKNDM